MELDALFEGQRVVITCGAGGVGKTTSAAALACRAAQTGRKVAVLTVDPARRLASSMGLSGFTGEAQRVVLPGDGGASGELDAMMLDTQSTYDRLVRRYATSPEQVEAIISNAFYRHFSGAIGGSHEFTAMERLYELVEQNEWDLLVLDTPPTVHALDFLDAPQRLIDAFDESIFKWVVKPYLMAGKVGVQVLSFGSAYIFKTLTRFAGGEMMEELSEFLLLFQGMFEGFRERARIVQELLKADTTSFLIVTTPQRSSLQEATHFHNELKRMGLSFGGFIINRAFVPLDSVMNRDGVVREIQSSPDYSHALSGAFVDRLMSSQNDFQSTAMRQERNLSRFLAPIEDPKHVLRVPLFDGDVADVAGLLRFAESMTPRNAK